MVELPTAAVDRVIRKGGATRVSEGAARTLAEQLEEEGIKIAQKAVNFATHAKRRTVTEEDIRLAIKTKEV
ncbi:MAG: histone [Candidatus Diapherotrites archaeon CG08_land_8_20_14_0_20_34_12]|nr:MAG: histone [Candidatus Diapherotrites archaeon CG08_land_8_20_14_0_20_34_12]